MMTTRPLGVPEIQTMLSEVPAVLRCVPFVYRPKMSLFL